MALTFIFNADGSRYTRGLEKMRGQTKKWAGGIKSMIGTAFAVGAVVAFTRKIIAFGSQMSDLAAQTRTTVKEFMTFRDAARDAGVAQSILERGLRNVMLRSQQAFQSNNNYRKSLIALGIDFREFVKLSTAEKFIEIAKASKAMAGEVDTARNVANLLGDRAGPQLVEVLDRLATEGFDKVAEAAVLMSEETAAALDDAEDRWQRLGDTVTIRGAQGLLKLQQLFDLLTGENAASDAQGKADQIEGRSLAGGVRELQSFGAKFTDAEIAELVFPSDETVAFKVRILNKYQLSLLDFYKAIAKAKRREADSTRDQIEADKERRKGLAEDLQREQDDIDRVAKIATAQEKLTKILEDQLGPTEKMNKLLKEQSELMEGFSLTDQPGSAEELENIKKMTRFQEIELQLSSLNEEKKAKAQGVADKIKKLEDDALEKSSQIAKVELEILAKNDAARKLIEDAELETPVTGVIASSLAAIGGGGNVASFTSDPILAANLEANKILTEIEKNTQKTPAFPTIPEI